jgi:hypothetical protein
MELLLLFGWFASLHRNHPPDSSRPPPGGGGGRGGGGGGEGGPGGDLVGTSVKSWFCNNPSDTKYLFFEQDVQIQTPIVLSVFCMLRFREPVLRFFGSLGSK